MNIDKTIEKWEAKHHLLLDEYSKGNKDNEIMQLYRSRMKDMLDFINDLKHARTSVQQGSICTHNTGMKDNEFNMHKHWKDAPTDDDDYGSSIKHFQD